MICDEGEEYQYEFCLKRVQDSVSWIMRWLGKELWSKVNKVALIYNYIEQIGWNRGKTVPMSIKI